MAGHVGYQWRDMQTISEGTCRLSMAGHVGYQWRDMQTINGGTCRLSMVGHVDYQWRDMQTAREEGTCVLYYSRCTDVDYGDWGTHIDYYELVFHSRYYLSTSPVDDVLSILCFRTFSLFLSV